MIKLIEQKCPHCGMDVNDGFKDIGCETITSGPDSATYVQFNGVVGG